MKLLMVGLDGATFEIIDRLIEDGKLETISKLVDSGVKSVCESTIPPLTCPAWPSIITGCNPGKHGLFHFVDPDGKINTFNDLKKPTFWEILSENGISCGIINVPLTYPPRKINGIIITGMLTPPGRRFTYPPELEKELRGEDYVVDYPAEIIRYLKFDKKYIDKLIEIERSRTETAIRLNNRENFDLMFIVYQAPDIVQHRLWEEKDYVYKVYEELDQEIEKLVESFRPENIIIISDHGFSSYKKQLNMNQLLLMQGLVKKRKIEKVENVELRSETKSEKEPLVNRLFRISRKITFKIGLTQENVLNILPSIAVKFLRRYIPTKWRRALFEQTKYVVDMDESQAYMKYDFELGVWINRKKISGRYDAFRNEIIRILESYQDPISRTSVMEWVKKKEEVYTGEFTKKAPDIIFKPKAEYYPLATFGRDVVEENTLWGHSFDGIFIANGKAFKRDIKASKISVYDIVPTVLYIFGIPKPTYVDGKTLLNFFDDRFKPSIKPLVDEKDRIKSQIKKLRGRL